MLVSYKEQAQLTSAVCVVWKLETRQTSTLQGPKVKRVKLKEVSAKVAQPIVSSPKEKVQHMYSLRT